MECAVFQNACEAAFDYVIPIVVAWRQSGGKINWLIGSGTLIHEEGWFVTAAHIIETIYKLQELQKSGRKDRKTKQRITDVGVSFGITCSDATGGAVSGIDFSVGKLSTFVPKPGQRYAKLRSDDVKIGEMCCRVGFPFVDELGDPTWDKNTGFSFTNLFPVPMFVNEGMVSRFANVNDTNDNHIGKWIETSSPGLKGQSGGPLLDINGCVCGIQVNTAHYPLDFSGKGRNQVLNVGRAVHVETMRSFLDQQSVPYYIDA